MDYADNKQISRYASRARRKVSGWFGRTDAEIFKIILSAQNDKNLSGSVAEIGVHHGKSFIELCMAIQNGESAYCVDIFEDQHLNLDNSGNGSKRKLEANLLNFGIDLSKVVIEQNSSLNVTAEDITNTIGTVRFFSVDGGHWLEIVKNDLQIAEGCLAEHGIIALDDFHRPEWPDVSAGYFAWYASRRKPIVPFAIGFNKLYLCLDSYAEFYKEKIYGDKFLRSFISKKVVFQGAQIPVFSEYHLPEHGTVKRGLNHAKLYYPNLYYYVHHFKAAYYYFRGSTRDVVSNNHSR
jgi:hypothetical protein